MFVGIAMTPHNGHDVATPAGTVLGQEDSMKASLPAKFRIIKAAALALAPMLSYLPMASMAALLLIVAWNMSDIRHFAHTLRVAPRSDVAVLLTCFSLTVLFDMVVAVGVGIVMAALLFMRRMAEISGSRLLGEGGPTSREDLPDGVVLYEIAGPLFFGAAEKAVRGIATAGNARVLVLDMQAVPAMDATGLVAFESLLKRMQQQGTRVALAGVNAQPLKVLEKAGIHQLAAELTFHTDVERALEAV